MVDYSIYLASVTLENFKNVEHGVITMNSSGPYSANICGVYGQNGSGKTALVDAIEILKTIMCGEKLDNRFVDFIMVDKEYAVLKYVFCVTDKSGVYTVEYKTKLGKENNILNGNSDDVVEELIPVIYDEVLSYSFDGNDNKIHKNTLISTESDKDIVFTPANKYKSYFGNDLVVKSKLMLYRELNRHQSISFVFSRGLLNQVRLKSQDNTNDDFITFKSIIETLIYYANMNLFVINTANSGVISLNSLPLSIRYEEDNSKRASGRIMLNLDKNTVIPEYQFELIKKVFAHMNIVLEQIVPGLKIEVDDLGPADMSNGEKGRIIALKSLKNNKPIPLEYESEGIKKIISILQLLIAVYNLKNITVVIDELDSGVFEYLLGELLKIISEKGEGQLIFTSHNLRPLETLDKRFIVFSTTNPAHRYIRFTNVKTNNNLRDFYYRNILLDEQAEEVYAPTNNAEIAMAFREAGEVYDS